jgi:hypothetical protein
MIFTSFSCLHELVYEESVRAESYGIATLPLLVCPVEEQPLISCRVLSHLSVAFVPM